MVNQPIGNHGLGIFWWVGFDLGVLLQGQTRIAKPKSAYKFKGAYISLIIGHRGFGCEDNYRKSCAPNLLLVSDLTLDPSFKVKCGSTYL